MPIISVDGAEVFACACYFLEDLVAAGVDAEGEHVLGRGEVESVHESVWIGEGALCDPDSLGQVVHVLNELQQIQCCGFFAQVHPLYSNC